MTDKRRICILGAGGLARETRAVLAEHSDQYTFAGFVVSDTSTLGDFDSRDDVLGTVDELIAGSLAVDGVVCGIGTPQVRARLYHQIVDNNPSLNWPALISRRALLVEEATLACEPGAVICAGVIITVNVRVEANAFVNLAVTVGHETVIGAHSVINPSVNLSGGVVLGHSVLVGTGAQILQYLSIGDEATVGAASCVTKDVAPRQTVVGIPAKPFGKRDPA